MGNDDALAPSVIICAPNRVSVPAPQSKGNRPFCNTLVLAGLITHEKGRPPGGPSHPRALLSEIERAPGGSLFALNLFL